MLSEASQEVLVQQLDFIIDDFQFYLLELSLLTVVLHEFLQVGVDELHCLALDEHLQPTFLDLVLGLT